MNKRKFRPLWILAFGALCFVCAYAVEIGGKTYTSIPTLFSNDVVIQSGDQGSGTLTVGSGTTAFTNPKSAKMTFANGATSGTVAMAGVTATSKVTATVNAAPTNAVYLKYAKPEAGAVDVVMSGDPGTTLTITVQATQ